MADKDMARPTDQALVSDQAPAGLDPSGFDPSRITRPGFDQRLTEFEAALFEVRWIAERVMAGQQFNCYPTSPETGEDEWDDDCEHILAIGPVSDCRFVCRVPNAERAQIIESALKVATEAFLEKVVGDSAAPQGDRP